MKLTAIPLKSATAVALQDRLETLLPLIEAKAQEAEAQGHMSDEVVAALRAAGIYTMLFPREVGGAEISHFEAMEIVEQLAHAHGSTGWCTIVNNFEGTALAIYVDQKGVDEVFAKGPDITIAGNGVPRGFARKVEGGYEIWGKWAYGSGIQHAEWIHTGCFLTDDDGKMIFGANGSPKVVICHHPRDTIELRDNWDVLGLRATGSFDYAVREGDRIFLPSHMVYDFDIGAPLRGNAQGAIGLAGYSAWGHTSWALGVGRRMLDELVKVIVPRRDAFGPSADSGSFKFQFAQAEAKFRAARAMARETWKSVSDSCQAGQPVSQEQMTMVKLTLRHVHDVVSETATFAHRAARGASLHNTVMQRCYRDIHAGTQHILMADQIVEECGRALLGITDPAAGWTVFGVNDRSK